MDTLKVKILITKKLEIIDQSDEISETIWKEVSSWDYFTKDTIGKLIHRVTDSVSVNLSEGRGRYSYADRKRFAYYARGSLFETINWLEKALTRALIGSEKGEQLLSDNRILARRINAFIKTLKQP